MGGRTVTEADKIRRWNQDWPKC